MHLQRRARAAVTDALAGDVPIVALVAPAGHGKAAILEEVAAAADGPVARARCSLGGAATLGALRSIGDAPLVLVDHVEQLDEAERTAVAAHIEHLARSGVRVVVASQTWPALPLRRWQVDGLADVVLAASLLIDRAGVATLGLDGDDLQRAMDATRGWPSAVALLARHLRDAPFDDALAAAVEDHVAYVADEVLAPLTDDERSLLAAASVLDHLDRRVVVAVVGDDGAAARLRAIADRTQLLVPEGAGYGWHPDVREACARELERTDPGSVRRRHRVAAASLGDDPRHVAARLGHLMQAEAWEEGIALVAAHWAQLLEPDSFDALVGAVETAPAECFGGDPVHALGAGALMLLSGRPVRAAVLLDGPVVQTDPSARATALALRAHATWWSTAPERALDDVEEVAALIEPGSGVELIPIPGYESITTGRSMLDVSRVRALALLGRVAEAAELLRDLPDLPLDDPAADSVSAWATKAMIDALVGDLRSASAATETALALAAAGGWSSSPSLAPAHLAEALIIARSGAGTGRGRGVAAAATSATRARAWALLRVARAVAALGGDVDRDPPPDRGGHVHVPLADQIMAAWRARAALRRDDLLEAAALLAVTEPTELTLGPWTEVALVVHHPADVARTVSALPPPGTAVGRIVRQLVDAALLPEGPERTDVARGAVADARSKGLTGVLLEAPAPVWDEVVRSEHHDSTIAALATRLGPDLRPDLSDREVQILGLLDGPLPIGGIGRELYLSANTVKWYVGRIYRKLDVHSRTAAVERSRELGLHGDGRPSAGIGTGQNDQTTGTHTVAITKKRAISGNPRRA